MQNNRDLSSSSHQQTNTQNESTGLNSTMQTQRLRQPPQFPPDKPSEFQKFVAATTGQRLNIYGADLFRNVPTSFTPSNLTPASSDYIIGPDDELRVHIWGAISYNGNLRVDRSGNIYLPRIGVVHVAGLKFSELDQHLRAATGRVFRNFDLSAELGRIRSIQIYLTGQARRPEPAGFSTSHSVEARRQDHCRLRPLRASAAWRQIGRCATASRRRSLYSTGGAAGGRDRQHSRSGDLRIARE
jgi:hypothetical protein